MSQPSAVKLERAARKRKQKDLRQRKKKQGNPKPPTQTLPNRKSPLLTVEDQQEAEQRNAEEQLKVYRGLLPTLLGKASRIPDPRNPNQTKHEMTVLMLYGILMFVFQMTSRREANREITKPKFEQSLREAFPELTTMPHQDTLSRLLERMNVDEIESMYRGLLRQLIRKKKFRNMLSQKRYLVAVDGTQKYALGTCPDERCPKRTIQGKTQYYVYVLEACLVFPSGMVLPLMSEFLENSPEAEQVSAEQWKQDCERKAFYRLARRLKQAFPKLSIQLLLDGLYAVGPVFKICRANHWQFMIVFKDGVLPSVWANMEGLRKEKRFGEEHTFTQEWNGRTQTFQWVNDSCYMDSEGNEHALHIAECEETWEEIDKDGDVILRKAHHAWLSSERLSKNNIHERCNLVARKRWLQENNILKEKRQGYAYEHKFSEDWEATKGYHHLMHIGRLMNELATYTVPLRVQVKEQGIRGILAEFRITVCRNTWDAKRIQKIVEDPGQLRLVWEDTPASPENASYNRTS